jgi:hypothetical protein
MVREDWKNEESHGLFEQSSQSQELQATWGKLTGKPVKGSSYVFPNWENTRRKAFTKSSYGDIVSTILTFQFPSDFYPQERILGIPISQKRKSRTASGHNSLISP